VPGRLQAVKTMRKTASGMGKWSWEFVTWERKRSFVYADDFGLRVTLRCRVLCERARRDANESDGCRRFERLADVI
jgi:hypothetical protein